MKREERLKEAFEFLKSKGLASMQKDISVAMGASKSNVSSAFAGVESVLTDKFLLRFNKSFGDIFDEDWLLTGEGTMLKSSPSTINQTGEVNSVNNAGTTTINNSGLSDTDIRALFAQCQATNDKAVRIMETASTLMQETLALQRDMRNDRQNTLDLYNNIHAIQQEHIAKSREWIEGSKDNIKSLRDELSRLKKEFADNLDRQTEITKQMIDAQTRETEAKQDDATARIINLCRTWQSNDVSQA